MSTPSENTPRASDAPLQSTLRGEPDMAELVAFFVQEMGSRVSSISAAAEQHDVEQLQTIAHQLKGSAGGYGFSPIAESASVLEELIKTGSAAEDLTGLRQQVDELIDLCRRASA